MDFYNAYSQGFVRVAACTQHTTIGDPAANAASVLGLARACHDEGVALAVFPELTLSGYSIEDVLLQDALLDAVEDELLDVVTAFTTPRSSFTAGRCSVWRPSHTCPPIESSMSDARWHPETKSSAPLAS